MELVKQKFTIMTPTSKKHYVGMVRHIEACGKTCYRSHNAKTYQDAEVFISGIIRRGHESVIEHSGITVSFLTDRAVSHELVRHRLSSFSQESQRYVNYNKHGLQFIIPTRLEDSLEEDHYTDRLYMESGNEGVSFINGMLEAETRYLNAMKDGLKPEDARVFLPNATATRLVVTSNLRQWRTIFTQRTKKDVYPQTRELMQALLSDFKKFYPVFFSDITYIGEHVDETA